MSDNYSAFKKQDLFDTIENLRVENDTLQEENAVLRSQIDSLRYVLETLLNGRDPLTLISDLGEDGVLDLLK